MAEVQQHLVEVQAQIDALKDKHISSGTNLDENVKGQIIYSVNAKKTDIRSILANNSAPAHPEQLGPWLEGLVSTLVNAFDELGEYACSYYGNTFR